MAIIAPTFDFMKVAPGDDAHLYHYFANGNGIDPDWGTRFRVTASGLNVTVQTGMVMVQGRMIKNTSNLAIAVPANSSGSIVITVDLTKTNTFSGTPGDDNYNPVNNQVRIERVAALVQQDLLNGGSIYMFELATYTSNGSVATVTPANFNNSQKEVGQNLLFYGSNTWNQEITLPDNYQSYSIIEVMVSFSGNVSSAYMIRGNNGNYGEARCAGINLADADTDKGYYLGEVVCTMTGNKVKMASCKRLTNTGSIAVNAATSDQIAITRVIGIR